MGCTSRNLLQQLGRFRQLSQPKVLTLISSNKDNRITSPEDAHSNIMQELSARRTLLLEKYRTLLSFDVENRDGDLVLSPDWLSTILAFNKAENNVNFFFALSNQAKAKGFHISGDVSSIEMSRDFQQSLVRVEEAEVELYKRIHRDIKFDELQEIMNACEAAVNANESDKEIREKLAICKLLSI